MENPNASLNPPPMIGPMNSLDYKYVVTVILCMGWKFYKVSHPIDLVAVSKPDTIALTKC